MTETKNNLPRCALALSRLGATVWRNNVGQGWVGKLVKIYRAGMIEVGPGDVVLRSARPLHAGLCVGSPDLVGDYTITITPEMVGRTVAVALYPEVKSKDGRAREGQAEFRDAALQRGAIAGIVRDETDCERLIEEWKRGSA